MRNDNVIMYVFVPLFFIVQNNFTSKIGKRGVKTPLSPIFAET